MGESNFESEGQQPRNLIRRFLKITEKEDSLIDNI